jgi:mannose-1-phosphate guanylyltransferase
MDIGRDIAYHIRLVSKKRNGKIFATWNTRAACIFSIDMPNPIYALILAGGSGERFWPLSRRARPKQLLRLISDKTLLEETVVRLEGLVPRERILILTNTEQEAAVRELLPDLPRENIVAEPAKRDTAAAVALGTGWVVGRDHAATMIVLPADHVIGNRAAFQETLMLAAGAAEETGELVTIGIKPTWACSGFGYIEHGEPIHLRRRNGKDAIHRVLRFREKPNPDLAESFLRKGNFRWNAGMFVWSVPTVLSEFNRHAPELADFVSQLCAPGNFEKALNERFSKLPQISFDYAIMEKADRVLVVEATFDWDDIGSWRAVASYFKSDAEGNAANCAITALDSSNNIIFDEGGSSIALLGVHNLIVVRTGDAVLVCHRRQAEKIKDLIGKLPPELQ